MNLLVHRRFVFDELFIRIEKRKYEAAIQNLTALIIEIIGFLEVKGSTYIARITNHRILSGTVRCVEEIPRFCKLQAEA